MSDDEKDARERWSNLSDEDLAELSYGASDRRETMSLPVEIRERAGRLASEISKELRRRERERPSYRGPGRYKHREGYVYEVFGTLARESVILHLEGYPEGELLSETVEQFNSRSISRGERRYEYVGPLAGRELRPTCREAVEAALDETARSVPNAGHAFDALQSLRRRLLGES